jgi:hypothetical protein
MQRPALVQQQILERVVHVPVERVVHVQVSRVHPALLDLTTCLPSLCMRERCDASVGEGMYAWFATSNSHAPKVVMPLD